MATFTESLRGIRGSKQSRGRRNKKATFPEEVRETNLGRASSRSRFSKIKERQARLSGRPLTLTEAAAPYEALAETAASRLATGKGLELEEQKIATQASQFGQTLAQTKSEEARRSEEFDLKQILERERLAEMKRAEKARLREMTADREAQMAAAESAGTRETWATAIGTGYGVYTIGKDLGWWGVDTAAETAAAAAARAAEAAAAAAARAAEAGAYGGIGGATEIVTPTTPSSSYSPGLGVTMPGVGAGVGGLGLASSWEPAGAAAGAYGGIGGSPGLGVTTTDPAAGQIAAGGQPVGTYLGYGMTAYAGYSFGQSAKEQYEAGEISRTASRVKSVMYGATWGTMASPGIGTIFGAAAGLLGSCIIVSSCTDPDSHEVNITREFRDKHLDPITLKGYYELAGYIVPLIKTSEQFKQYIKETLVDRLVDFGEWFMGYKGKLKYYDSEVVTRNFLTTCYLIGV